MAGQGAEPDHLFVLVDGANRFGLQLLRAAEEGEEVDRFLQQPLLRGHFFDSGHATLPRPKQTRRPASPGRPFYYPRAT